MQNYEQRLASLEAHLREKYTQADRDRMAASGEAMPDGSYPIADEEDLDNAIHAVGRGNDGHDAIRKHIIARAKALGLSSKIPDNWAADGSLTDEQKAANWDAHRREGMPSYSDMYDLLTTACSQEFLDKDDDGWLYVQDFTDSWVVFAKTGGSFQAPYTIDGDTVTFGDAVPVCTVTSYVPVEAKSAKVPAVPKRTFFSAVERPVPVELRMALDDGSDPGTANFVGYASTTGQPYAVRDWLGEYNETMMPGCFAKTLREQSDIPLLFNHDGIPLASTGSGTSRLAEDGHGLRNEATLDRSDGLTNTICVQLGRKVLRSMSFSFQGVKDSWNDAYDDRQVAEAKLFDTSIVTYPANPTTTAELRNQFREALGREGLGAFFGVRAALGTYAETRSVDPTAEPVLEQAMRALAGADEVMCRRSAGPYVRSRTFLVAALLEQVRKGAVLSAKNQALLTSAVDALNGAATSHATTASHLQKASDAAAQIQANASNVNDQAADADGTGANQGAPAGDNPVSPTDGAGPRSAVPPSVAKARQQLAKYRL